MKNSQETKLIENLKKQIKLRKEAMSDYSYTYAIKTVADSIIPYDSTKSIKPAVISTDFNF